MTKTEQAYEVMLKTRDQLIGEIAAAGQAGGTGRAQNYAPVLAHVCKCIAELQSLMMEPAVEKLFSQLPTAPAQGAPADVQPSFAEKMKAARAAKKAQA